MDSFATIASLSAIAWINLSTLSANSPSSSHNISKTGGVWKCSMKGSSSHFRVSVMEDNISKWFLTDSLCRLITDSACVSSAAMPATASAYGFASVILKSLYLFSDITATSAF